MDKEEILAMEAGKELDALVAEVIFGCQIYRHTFRDWQTYCPGLHKSASRLHKYSQTASAAWLVEERIKELGLTEDYGNRLDILALSDEVSARQRVFDTAHASPELRCKAALFAKLEIKL